jgi:hypothetical protein
LKSNGPFKPEIDEIMENFKDDELITTIIKTIPERIPLRGVLNHGQLTENFEKLKNDSLLASYIKPSNSLSTFIFSKIISFLIFEERGNVSGDSVDAKLSRSQFYLNSGHLEKAISEVESLSPSSRLVLEDWLVKANNRLIVDQALVVLQSHLINLTQQIN